MKFLGQDDKNSCGPISIINALKILGYNHGTLEWFKTFCKTNVYGTTIENIDKSIKELGISNISRNKPSTRYIDRVLKNKEFLIVTYFWKAKSGKEFGHAMLCVGKYGEHYKVINHISNKEPIQYIKKEELKRLLKYKTKDKFISKVWAV